MLSCREAQCISNANVTWLASSSRSRMMPCVLGDAVNIKGVIVTHSKHPAESSMATSLDLLPLCGPASSSSVDALRDVDTNSPAFTEFVYLIWLGRRVHMQMRAQGQQGDVAFRPDDLIKVSLYGEEVS